MRRASLRLLFVLFSACSSADFTVPADQTDSSTSGGDTSATDATADTHVEDTAVEDSTLVDGGVADTDAKDTSVGDTGSDAKDSSVVDSAFDTGVVGQDTGADTGAIDAGPADTGKNDTGTPDTSDGAVCPMPTNPRIAPNPSGDCMQLTTLLASTFDAARACGCDADCSELGTPGGCACGSYINPGSDGYPEYVAAQAMYEKNLCRPKFCPGLPCALAKPQCVLSKCASLSIISTPDGSI